MNRAAREMRGTALGELLEARGRLVAAMLNAGREGRSPAVVAWIDELVHAVDRLERVLEDAER